MKSSFCKSKLPLPLRNSELLAGVFYEPRASFSNALLKIVLPATILWAIVSVWIFAPDGMIGRGLRAHVSQESSESTRPKPTLADRDAATAVIGVAEIALCVAPALHGFPTPVTRRADHRAIGSGNSVGVLARKATARFDTKASEASSELRGLVPAFALAHPSACAALPALRLSDDSELVVGVAGEVNVGGHKYFGFGSTEYHTTLDGYTQPVNT